MSYKGEKKMSRQKKIILGFLVPIGIVFFWWIVTSQGKVASSLLPSLPMVGNAF